MLRRLLAACLATSLVLTACGDDSDPEPDDQAIVDAVEVEPGEDGSAPTLEFDQPLAVGTTVRQVIAEGEGEAAADGSRVTFEFLMLNGRNGSTLSSSYDSQTADVLLDDQLLPGVKAGLLGLQAGAEAVVAIAPDDAFAGQGDQGGVNEDDSLVMHVVIERVSTPLERAEGAAVAPADGLPAVTLDDTGKPSIDLPGGAPPAELVAQTLIEGTGPEVEAGQGLVVHYTGVLWDGGQQFDSSWDRGAPAIFDIGVRAVIDGWDEGLVGRTVGSQVLLVIPPDKGYGDGGQGTIPPGATLVFVIDILDAG